MTNSILPGTQNRTPVNRKLWLGLLGCLLLIVVVCYANTLGYGLVFNDELSLLQCNKAQADTNWTELLLRPLHQPWVRQSLVQDEANYKTAFGWYHLVNVWFHLVSAVALFCLIFRLSWRWRQEERSSADPYLLAGAAAMLFAAHPLAVQSATYLSARYSCLGACNYLLALNAFLFAFLAKSGAGRFWGYALCLASSWMSLSSFEAGITVPLALLAVFFAVKPLKADWRDWACDHPIVCGVVLALTIAVPFAVCLGQEPAAAPNAYGLPALPSPIFYATQAKAFLTYYLRCFMVPLGLSIDPPFAVSQSWAELGTIGGALALLGVIAFTVWAAMKQRPAMALGLFLVLAGYLPHALIPQVERVSDAAFYLPLAGLSLLAACLLEPLLRGSLQHAGERFVPLLVVLCGLSIAHNLDFRNDATLIAQTLKVNDKSAIGHTLSATSAYGEKKYEQALAQADQAIAADPSEIMAWLTKGAALGKLEMYAAGQQVLQKAVDLSVHSPRTTMAMARFSLAENYLQQRKVAEAEELMRTSMQFDPYNPRVRYLLGLIDYQHGQYEQAASFFSQAYRQGIFDSLGPLANCALHLQKFKEAVQISQLAVMSGDRNAQISLANAALNTQQLPVAERAIGELQKTRPDQPVVMALQSMLAARKGDLQQAQALHNDALARDPHVFSQLVEPKAPVPLVPTLPATKRQGGK